MIKLLYDSLTRVAIRDFRNDPKFSCVIKILRAFYRIKLNFPLFLILSLELGHINVS